MSYYRNKMYSNVPIRSKDEYPQTVRRSSIYSAACFAVSAVIVACLFITDPVTDEFSNTRGLGSALSIVRNTIAEDESVSVFLQDDTIEEDHSNDERIAAAALEYIEAHRPKYIFPLDGEITSAFAFRTDPILGDVEEYHTGIDISAANDIEICSYADGTVKNSVISDTGYGNYVVIEHDGFETLYAHCSKLLVSKGDTVKAGDLIAIAGSTGRSTGTHLHFEIRIDGSPVDPMGHIEENGAKKYA